MTLIDTIRKSNNEGKSCLITYVTAGDPDIDTSYKILESLSNNGADIIELGIPFSDPISDGPTIQKASERALSNKMTIPIALDMIKKFRRSYQTPIIVFGYFNPFLQYGLKKVMKDIRKVGAEGVLIVDLPPEESFETQLAADYAGLELVYLLAPTSTKERIGIVSKLSNSFIYLVSVTGVTGVRKKLDKNLQSFIANIKQKTNKPVCVGFGISEPAHVKQLKTKCDGIVIGSAIISIIENNLRKKGQIISKISNFISKIKKSTFI